MEPAGHRIGALFELAARVQDRQRHFGGRLLLRGMYPGRNAASVIHDCDAVVDVDRHLDRLTESRHMFIDTVVDDFIDEVMEAVHTGAANVHRRPLSHGVQAFQYFDLIRAVTVGFRRGLSVVTGHQSPV